MTLDLDEATLQSKLHLIDTLDQHLPGELTAAESSDYPLPPPEAYIEETIDRDWERPFRNLNVVEVAMVVFPFSPTTGETNYTGDGTKHTRREALEFDCQAVFRYPGGFGAFPVNSRGRKQTEREWMSTRAEKYKGAVINALTKNVTDGEHVENFDIVAHDAQVPASEQFGNVAVAGVLVSFNHDALVYTQ